MSLLTRSACVTAAALAFCSCLNQVGNGVIVTETTNVRSFTKVSVDDGLTVSIIRGDRSVQVTTDQNLQALFVFDVDGDTLKVRRRSNFRMDPSSLLIEVRNDVLEGLEVNNGSQVSADATPAGDWRLTVKDGSSVSLSLLETQDFKVEASGSSRIDVFGVSRDVTIKAKGASQVNADGVSAANVTIDASGASIVNANASGSVNINASGGSQVSITGNPASRQTDSSGGSQVNFFNQ